MLSNSNPELNQFRWKNDVLTNIQSPIDTTQKQTILNDFFDEEMNEPIYRDDDNN